MNKKKSFETSVQNQFGAFCIKVLKNEMKNIYREMDKQHTEIDIEQIPVKELNSISVHDNYFDNQYVFNVYGKNISVYGDEIANAIQKLSPYRRNIILLSFFTDLTDREIATLMQTVHQSISRGRKKSLAELRAILELEQEE